MNSNPLIIQLCLLLALACSVMAMDATQQSFEYMCEDIPPSNYLEHGELKGISVDLLKLMWKSMNVPEQPIRVVPWARGYEMVKSTKNHVLFSMTRTPERESTFKWVGPIFTVRNVLIGRAGTAISIHSLEDAKKYRIGTIIDDVVEKSLLENNFDRSKTQGVSALKQNFDKLRLGRIDLIAHTEQTLYQFINDNQYNANDYKVYFVMSESKNYYAFQHDTPDSLIQRFQSALNGLAMERINLLKKYNLPLAQ